MIAYGNGMVTFGSGVWIFRVHDLAQEQELPNV
jgi:hypothetical protein